MPKAVWQWSDRHAKMQGVAKPGASACLEEDKSPSLALLAQVTLKPAKLNTKVVSTAGQA